MMDEVAVATAVEPDRSDGPTNDRWRPPPWAWPAAALLAVVSPIVIAAIRAVTSGYRPVGDDGLLLVRIRDVGGENWPLLGSWTSASLSADTNFNNPGPIYGDLVAPAVKLVGPWSGLVLGVMVVNAAAAVLIVLAAQRVAGRTGLVAAALTVTALEWTLGGEVLVDVLQPNALVLPALAFVVCLWALAGGWRWSLPFVVGLASLLVQTHVGYAYLVAISGVGGVVLLVWQERTEGRRDPKPWVRPGLTGLAVLAICWVQPLIEQLTSDGQGNLSRLWAASQGGGDASLGPSLAVRLVGQVLVRPPFWLRDSYGESIPLTWGDSSVQVMRGPLAAIGVLALVGLLLALGVVHHRRSDRPTATLALTAGLLVVAAVVSLSVTPGSFVLSAHQMRWLWAVAAFATMAVVVGLVRLRPLPAPWPTRLSAAAGALAAVFVVLNIPTYVPFDYTSMNVDARPVIARLDDQLASLRGEGPVLVDLSTSVFDDPYGGPLFAILQDHGVPFRVEPEPMVRQLGDVRRADGTERRRVWLIGGNVQPAPDSLPSGVRREALALGIDDDELRELERLRAALAADPADVDAEDRERAAELERLLAGYTVAVYSGPVDRPPSKGTGSITVGGTPSVAATGS